MWRVGRSTNLCHSTLNTVGTAVCASVCVHTYMCVYIHVSISGLCACVFHGDTWNSVLGSMVRLSRKCYGHTNRPCSPEKPAGWDQILSRVSQSDAT